MEAHVTECFGAPATVWHELVSPYVHVDIHIVEPTDERPLFTLVTSGMSERPMRAPDGDRYAELFLLLPPNWPPPDSKAGHWPYKLLQDLARLPHEYDTYLWTGHTVPNGDPPRPYAADTKLCGALIVAPFTVPDEFEVLNAADRAIQFLAVIPLHADEMQVKLDQGADALYDLLDEAEITELVQPDRPSVVPRRPRRLFRR